MAKPKASRALPSWISKEFKQPTKSTRTHKPKGKVFKKGKTKVMRAWKPADVFGGTGK